MVELTWNEYERFLDKGGKDSAVCLLEGSGTRVDFRAVPDDRDMGSGIGLDVVYESNTDGGEIWETIRFLVMAEILTERVRYVLKMVDQLFDKDEVERTFWLEEHDLSDQRLSGSSRIKLGCGFWGEMAEGMLPRIGVENLFKL
ncbi:MAG: hypothetical protein WAV56_01595 [Microgenomates group bacterium]